MRDWPAPAKRHTTHRKPVDTSHITLAKALVRKECVEFGQRFSASLPAEIESSKAEDLKRYLPNFMEERFRNFADRQGMELAKRLERVAEDAIAFVSEEARAKGERLAESFP